MSLNDQVAAYLSVNGLTAGQGDYQTVSSGGVESISIWNSAKFGAQPSASQLAAALTNIQLQQAKGVQISALGAAYQNAIAQNVSYTTKAGLTKSYQADSVSISNLESSLLGCQATQATPAGFFWVAADNAQVPFTYADLQGLAAVIFAQGATAFAKFQSLKGSVLAATTSSAVQAISW